MIQDVFQWGYDGEITLDPCGWLLWTDSAVLQFLCNKYNPPDPDFTLLNMYYSLNGGQTWNTYNQGISSSNCMQDYSGFTIETNYNDGWISVSIGQNNGVANSLVQGYYYYSWKFSAYLTYDESWTIGYNGFGDDVAPIKSTFVGTNSFIWFVTKANGTLYQRAGAGNPIAIGRYSRPEVRTDRRGK